MRLGLHLDLLSWNNVNEEVKHVILSDRHGNITPLYKQDNKKPLLHEAISDESFRMPVYDIIIIALLQFTQPYIGTTTVYIPYKVWLELLGLVHQTLKMMIFNIMQQISYYPCSSAIWQILALEET